MYSLNCMNYKHDMFEMKYYIIIYNLEIIKIIAKL